MQPQLLHQPPQRHMPHQHGQQPQLQQLQQQLQQQQQVSQQRAENHSMPTSPSRRHHTGRASGSAAHNASLAAWPAPGTPVPETVTGAEYQAEVLRRQVAENRVRELESLVARLRGRIAQLQVKKGQERGGAGETQPGSKDAVTGGAQSEQPDDAIDLAIRAYLTRNPDFPVCVQKVAPNYYAFGDRGIVYVTQRGAHVVVRVGGGFKSLQVFMDERALMLTCEAAGAVSDRGGA